MKDFLRKFKSRKFLTCIAGVVMGVCMSFGFDKETVDTIAGAIVAASSIVTYIYAEGKVDAGAVKDAADKVEEVFDAVKKH